MTLTLQGICSLSLGSILIHTTEDSPPPEARQEATGASVDGAPLDRFCTRLSSKIHPLITKGGKPVVRFFVVSESGTEVKTMPYGSQILAGGKGSKVRGAGLELGICGEVVTSGHHAVVPVTCNHKNYYGDMDAATADESHAPSLWLPLRSSSGRVAGIMAVFLLPNGDKERGRFSAEEMAMVRRIAQDQANYFADLAYYNSVRTERDRWKQTAYTILSAMGEVESAGKSSTVREVFSTVIDLDKCHVWVADNIKNVLTLQAGQGGGKQKVTVSTNGAGAVSKAARCGEVSTTMSIGGDGETEEWELVAPVMDSSGRPLVVVQGERVRLPFTPLDLGVIKMVSKFFSIAVEHARVLSTVSTRTFDEEVMESLTIEDAMKAVIMSASKLCRCHNALVYWPSPEGSMCQYYMEGGSVKMKNYFTTMGIAAACIADQKPMLLPNAREHPRFHEGLDGVELPIFKYGRANEDHFDGINSAYLPIYDKEETVPMAVLSVRDKKKRMAFTRTDLMSLIALTKQVAVALKNVEKHEGLLERARIRDIRHTQMSQLNSIRTMQIEAMAKIATRVPINTIAEGMTRSMSMLLGVEMCKLHILEERGTMVRSIGPSSLQDKLVEIHKASQSHVICRVIKSNEAVLIDLQTIQEDTSVKYTVDGVQMRNSLSVPLRSDSGQVFAVLQLVNKYEGSFSGSDELIVHMAGTAFETVIDAALLSSVRFDIGLESIDHSPEDIINLILEKTMQLVSADAGQVLQLVNDRKSLRRVAEITATGERVGVLNFVSGVDGHDNQVSTYDISQGIAGVVVQTKTTICVPKLRQDPRFDPAVDLKCDYTGQSSLLCAPLVSSMGQVMGAVEVVKSGVSQFNQRELQLMDVLATQAGTLLHNRERHEVQVARTVENIIAVTTSVMKCLEVQPSIDVIVNRIADRAVSVVPCENAVVLFRGMKKKSREVCAWRCLHACMCFSLYRIMRLAAACALLHELPLRRPCACEQCAVLWLMIAAPWPRSSGPRLRRARRM